jgi:hypothetical protein
MWQALQASDPPFGAATGDGDGFGKECRVSSKV